MISRLLPTERLSQRGHRDMGPGKWHRFFGWRNYREVQKDRLDILQLHDIASGVGPLIFSIQNVANKVAASAFAWRKGIFSMPPPPPLKVIVFGGTGGAGGGGCGCNCCTLAKVAMLIITMLSMV
jgi:hypothetical protein